MIFLMGLDDSFGTIKSQILSTKPLLGLGTVYHLVIEDEQQKNISVIRKLVVEVTAYRDRAAQSFETNYSNKHINREGLKCKHCNKTSHTIDSCFEKIGYPD